MAASSNLLAASLDMIDLGNGTEELGLDDGTAEDPGSLSGFAVACKSGLGYFFPALLAIGAAEDVSASSRAGSFVTSRTLFLC